MTEIFGPKVTPIQYPINVGPGFNAMIDVLLMKKYSWGPDGGVPTIEEIPAEEHDRAQGSTRNSSRLPPKTTRP